MPLLHTTIPEYYNPPEPKSKYNQKKRNDKRVKKSKKNNSRVYCAPIRSAPRPRRKKKKKKRKKKQTQKQRTHRRNKHKYRRRIYLSEREHDPSPPLASDSTASVGNRPVSDSSSV